MFETDGSAGHCGSLPSRLDCPGQQSLSTAAPECVGPTADHRLSVRGRACADAQGRCDGGWLQRNRLIQPSRTLHGAGGLRLSFLLRSSKPNHCISLVKSSEWRPWAKSAKTARLLLPGASVLVSGLGYRSCLHEQVSYPLRQPQRSLQWGKKSDNSECSYLPNVGCKERDPLHSPKLGRSMEERPRFQTGPGKSGCAWRIHKITQQSVSGTARDSASASDTRQDLSAIQVCQNLVGGLLTPRAFGAH